MLPWMSKKTNEPSQPQPSNADRETAAQNDDTQSIEAAYSTQCAFQLSYLAQACPEGREVKAIPVEFDQCGLDERLIKNCKELLMFKSLNYLQASSCAILQREIPLITMAPTGSGKTMAFLLPAIQIIIDSKKERENRKTNTPKVVILNVTSKLTSQTYEVARKALGCEVRSGGGDPISEVTVGLVTGGSFKEVNCDILVATMGSILQKIDEKTLKLEDLMLIVIDEADRMLDENAFGKDLCKFYDAVPDDVKDRLNCCFFSATYNQDEDGQFYATEAQQAMLRGRNPITLYLPQNGYSVTQRLIKVDVVQLAGKYFGEFQVKVPMKIVNFWDCEFFQKYRILKTLIDHDRPQMQSHGSTYDETIVIFVERKKNVNALCAMLAYEGYQFEPVSSDITKADQQLITQKLARGEIQGVVCTNVLARGFDEMSIRHVIIFDMPEDFTLYVHRIGRTGRAGRTGKATTFIGPRVTPAVLGALYQKLKANEQAIPDWLEAGVSTSNEAYIQCQQAAWD